MMERISEHNIPFRGRPLRTSRPSKVLWCSVCTRGYRLSWNIIRLEKTITWISAPQLCSIALLFTTVGGLPGPHWLRNGYLSKVTDRPQAEVMNKRRDLRDLRTLSYHLQQEMRDDMKLEVSVPRVFCDLQFSHNSGNRATFASVTGEKESLYLLYFSSKVNRKDQGVGSNPPAHVRCIRSG